GPDLYPLRAADGADSDQCGTGPAAELTAPWLSVVIRLRTGHGTHLRRRRPDRRPARCRRQYPGLDADALGTHPVCRPVCIVGTGHVRPVRTATAGSAA